VCLVDNAVRRAASVRKVLENKDWGVLGPDRQFTQLKEIAMGERMLFHDDDTGDESSVSAILNRCGVVYCGQPPAKTWETMRQRQLMAKGGTGGAD